MVFPGVRNPNKVPQRGGARRDVQLAVRTPQRQGRAAAAAARRPAAGHRAHRGAALPARPHRPAQSVHIHVLPRLRALLA